MSRIIQTDVKKTDFRSLGENMVLCLGAGMWPQTQRVRDKIRTVELAYYMRRCLQLASHDIVRNDEVLEKIVTSLFCYKNFGNVLCSADNV